MEETGRNPRYLMKCIRERNAADGTNHFPEIYVACGLQDPLIDANRSIGEALKESGSKVTYEEGNGVHNWYFWDEYIQHVLKWLEIPACEK
ncbi:MAG: hypothetical protein HFE94_05500 [Acutalibacter sp.]|nr:hypothetical protein [Acutalibacter sp.]